MSNDPADELRRQIDYNSTNLGEMGRFIRVEYVTNILENFVITDKRANTTVQNTRLDEIRTVLKDIPTGEEWAALSRIADIVFRTYP